MLFLQLFAAKIESVKICLTPVFEDLFLKILFFCCYKEKFWYQIKQVWVAEWLWHWTAIGKQPCAWV